MTTSYTATVGAWSQARLDCSLERWVLRCAKDGAEGGRRRGADARRGQGLEEDVKDSKRLDWIIVGVIVLIALAMRLYKIDHPAGVVCVLRSSRCSSLTR